MNLLTDAWIPVRQQAGIRHVTYREVLCHDDPTLDLGLNRDDFNLATLQLLICLTQVLFPPETGDNLLERELTPLTEVDFEAGIAPFRDWFELRHPTTPFMQTRGVMAKEITPIQKLFPGLPEGNNHAMFNQTDEVSAACESCVAIALFNQAMNCPGLGGGFKSSLRGETPINTFVHGVNLRRTLWRNVLTKESLNGLYFLGGPNDLPTWVFQISDEEIIPAGEIGMLRGLFWQPAHFEVCDWQEGICPVCSSQNLMLANAFNKEKFKFSIVGSWPHPHSPYQWTDKGEIKFDSFRVKTPAWTQLTSLVVEKNDSGNKSGHVPSAIVMQFRNTFGQNEPLHLIVGGYCNKKAGIIDRRHEIFSLAHGWVDSLEDLRETVETALKIKDVLRKKTYGFGKKIGLEGLADRTEEAYFHYSEPVLHGFFRELDWTEAATKQAELRDKLARRAYRIFVEICSPFASETIFDLKRIQAFNSFRGSLNYELAQFRLLGETLQETGNSTQEEAIHV